MKVGIIGGGFSGTTTAINLIRKSAFSLSIVIINEFETFNKGLAFNPYSKSHSLNVVASKMSAFSDYPDHFLDWVMEHDSYKEKTRMFVANAFLPRFIYGEYLRALWKETIENLDDERHSVVVVDTNVTDLSIREDFICLTLANGDISVVEKCVIATGNHIPRNPSIRDEHFFLSRKYFRNPWVVESVSETSSDLPILIIGNGLTMVDTIIGLLENKCQNSIYSISPTGFNILPHRHNGLSYTDMRDEFPVRASLLEIVRIFNRHIKRVREFGISAEPVIDSMRPLIQGIWQNLTLAERRKFMARLRHLWGVARHRLPMHVHDHVQQLRIDGRLRILAGRIIDMKESDEKSVDVVFFNKKTRTNERLSVCRVINCSGPETDLAKSADNFLSKCLASGIISQDELKLGLNADPNTFELVDGKGKLVKNLFTVGPNLKGVLWESTAVHELRDQSERLALSMLKIGHGALA